MKVHLQPQGTGIAVVDAVPEVKCGNCRFYDSGEGSMPWGNCMRFPPQSNGGFAVVLPQNWCGEYKRK